MADLATLFQSVLSGTLTALDKSEADHLAAHVDAIKAAGGNPSVDGILAAFKAGWLPDYYAAAGLEVSAQLAMSTARQQNINATGGVVLGPVQLNAQFGIQTNEATNTNLTVTARLERQSRSSALSNAFESLLALPAVNTPAVNPPNPVLPTGKP